jgi:hypothetical protein
VIGFNAADAFNMLTSSNGDFALVFMRNCPNEADLLLVQKVCVWLLLHRSLSREHSATTP